jgi:phosphoglycolate phosphatase
MTDALRSFAAVVFDFDGTLADSYAAIASSVNHVRAGHSLPPLALADVKRHVGRGPEYLLTHTVPGGNLPDDLACYRQHHPSVMFELTHLLPGVAELLPALRRLGKKIGLCSNKPRLFSQELLDHLGVVDCFDVVLGVEDVPRPKPAPDMLLAAIERLNVPKQALLYVGDMTVDIETARAAGVQVWVAPTGCDDRRTLADARPDRLLTDLTEMVAEIGRI